MPSPPVKIAKSEWDFSNCPKKEIYDCWTYEIARESDLIRDCVSTLRATYPDGLMSVARKTSQSFLLFSDWPKVPYLAIQPSQRRAIRKMVRPSDQELEAAFILQQINPAGIELLLRELRNSLEKGLRPRVVHSKDRQEFVLLHIDWFFPDSLLLQFFESYLKQYRPATVPLHERTGKETPDSKRLYQLQRLGMYRLLRANDWKVTRAMGAKQFNLSRTNRKAWANARKTIEKIVSTFTANFEGKF